MAKYKKIYHDYLDNKVKLERWQKISIFFLVIVVSGVFGWVYEFIFYWFNGGMQDFYLQGGNFLPWINIYAIGTILIAMLAHNLKKHPFWIFAVSFIATGILEYVSGWLVYTIGNGTRYWDYNTEILNFGNIDGYVCLRSVLIFGILALVLMYFVLPVCVYLAKRINKKTFIIATTLLFSVFMIDEFYNTTLTRIFDWPNAVIIYTSNGLKYVGW